MSVASNVAGVKPALYRYREVADMFGVTIRTIQWYVEIGYLDAVGSGIGVRVVAKSVDEWLRWREPAPEGFKPKGYIYLMRFRHYYKIGLTGNIKRRYSAIATSLPEPLELVHTIPTNDMARAEALLHSRFACRRHSGEWFKLTPSEVQMFVAFKSMIFEAQP